MSHPISSNKHKIVARLVAAIIIVAAVALVLYYYWQNSPLSEDAMLQADVVNISTPVPGRVEKFYVVENGRVKRGDLLYTLDPTVYRLRVEQAEAELKSAMAARDAKRRQIEAERANLTVANEQVERALSNLNLTEKTLERLIPLNKKGFVTTQQVDDARTLHRDAQVSSGRPRPRRGRQKAWLGTWKRPMPWSRSAKARWLLPSVRWPIRRFVLPMTDWWWACRYHPVSMSRPTNPCSP